MGMILLQTLSRLHVCATLAFAQVIGSVCVMVARATAPNRIGPGTVFPDIATWDFKANGLKGSPMAEAPFWIALICQLVIVIGYFWFYRKEQLGAFINCFAPGPNQLTKTLLHHSTTMIYDRSFTSPTALAWNSTGLIFTSHPCFRYRISTLSLSLRITAVFPSLGLPAPSPSLLDSTRIHRIPSCPYNSEIACILLFSLSYNLPLAHRSRLHLQSISTIACTLPLADFRIVNGTRINNVGKR